MNIESAAGVIFPESQMGKILQIRFETKTFTTLRSFYCIGNCNGDEDRLIFRLTNVADFDGKRIKYFPVPVFLFDDTKKTANMLSNELAGEGGNTIKFQDQHPAFHGQDQAGNTCEGGSRRIKSDIDLGTLQQRCIEDSGNASPLGRILFGGLLFSQQLQNHATNSTLS